MASSPRCSTASTPWARHPDGESAASCRWKRSNTPTRARAAAALADIDPDAYRPFNMVHRRQPRRLWVRLTDASDAAGRGGGRVSVAPLPLGLSMITAYDCNDERSPRIHRYLPQFAAARVPEPEQGDWSAWIRPAADRRQRPRGRPRRRDERVYRQRLRHGFVLRCSRCRRRSARRIRPIWLFAAGRPGRRDVAP